MGSPPDLYRAPRSMFAAGFGGSTKMNLIDDHKAGKHVARTICIRPEHAAISATGDLWQGIVAGHPGSDTFIQIHGIEGCDPMTVRTSGDAAINNGDTVYLVPNRCQTSRSGADVCPKP